MDCNVRARVAPRRLRLSAYCFESRVEKMEIREFLRVVLTSPAPAALHNSCTAYHAIPRWPFIPTGSV